MNSFQTAAAGVPITGPRIYYQGRLYTVDRYRVNRSRGRYDVRHVCAYPSLRDTYPARCVVDIRRVTS